LRISVRNDVMDLNAIFATAPDALLAVALQRLTAGSLPLLVVWSGRAAAPEVRQLATLGNGPQSVAAFPPADLALVEHRNIERLLARWTNPSLGLGVAPSVPEVARVRAVALRSMAPRIDAKRAPAAIACPRSTSRAPLRAISDWLEHGAAALAWLRFVWHAAIVRMNPAYADMAQRRITGDAPLFAEATTE
jgi:hypothetical protein